MKGIILAWWSGTRLYPITMGISKQLVPVYNKPMIYYPLSTLMMWGIREILIISTPAHLQAFKDLLGDGSQRWCSFFYKEQPSPDGLAQAFILGEEFIGDDSVSLILWDNIFYSDGLTWLIQSSTIPDGGIIFWYHVPDPHRFGVVEFNDAMKVVSIEEKPTQPKSHYAVPGLYFYDNSVVDIAKSIAPSERGELEITAVNAEYLKQDKLKVHLFWRGSAWFDTGTIESFTQANRFIEVVEKNQWVMIWCPEEIAYRKWFIDAEQLMRVAQPLLKSGYGKYLQDLVKVWWDYAISAFDAI